MGQFGGDQDQDRVLSSALAHSAGRDSKRRLEGDRLHDGRGGGEQDQVPFYDGMNDGA